MVNCFRIVFFLLFIAVLSLICNFIYYSFHKFSRFRYATPICSRTISSESGIYMAPLYHIIHPVSFFITYGLYTAFSSNFPLSGAMINVNITRKNRVSFVFFPIHAILTTCIPNSIRFMITSSGIPHLIYFFCFIIYNMRAHDSF